MIKILGDGGAMARFLTVLLGAAALAGCGDATTRGVGGVNKTGREPGVAGRPLVVCTTNVVADVARAVGGDAVEVVALMAPGVDPHSYKATPADRARLQSANVMLYNGLHLEGRMVETLQSIGKTKPAVAVAEKLPADKVRKTEQGQPDPHVWFDVALWAETGPIVAAAIAEVVPAPEKDALLKRGEAWKAETLKLAAECQAALDKVPKEKRVLVTAHDAFSYFGRAFGVEVRAVQGISTEADVGLKDLNGLVDFLVARKIPAVFAETSVPEGNVRALVEGCQARGHDLKLGGKLYSDSLGSADSPAATYAGTVRANVGTIVEGLGGNMPAGSSK